MMFERFTDEARTVGEPASEVLCAYGLTPEFVEEEIVRRVGLGAGGGLFGGLDSEALATIGIDVDAVRATVEASFGPGALARAARTAHPEPRRFDPRPRSGAQRAADQPAGVEDLALGILAVTEGLVPPILSALGASGAALSAAILDRSHSAH